MECVDVAGHNIIITVTVKDSIAEGILNTLHAVCEAGEVFGQDVVGGALTPARVRGAAAGVVTGGGTCSITGELIECAMGSVSLGQTKVISVVGTVSQSLGDSIDNVADVTIDEFTVTGPPA